LELIFDFGWFGVISWSILVFNNGWFVGSVSCWQLRLWGRTSNTKRPWSSSRPLLCPLAPGFMTLSNRLLVYNSFNCLHIQVIFAFMKDKRLKCLISRPRLKPPHFCCEHSIESHFEKPPNKNVIFMFQGKGDKFIFLSRWQIKGGIVALSHYKSQGSWTGKEGFSCWGFLLMAKD